MKREIKFRAWNPIENELEYWTLNDLCYHQPPDRPDICLQNWQEYTGLKDKNGKEIYEGDILQSKRVSGVAQIYYSETHLAFRYGFFPFSYPPAKPMLKDLFLGGYLYKLGTKAHEIIGNIYENPELLK